MAEREHVGRLRAATPTVPNLVAGTLVAVYLTVLLGVLTKATGAGLACSARWPLCNGGLLNLFPADAPSAFEWVHRVVAGATGFAILGTAVAAWRRDTPRHVRRLVALALVLLPVQVLLGRATVLSFTVPVLVAHFWVAFAIFAAFATAAALSWRASLTPGRLRGLAVAAAALVPLQVLLHPPVVTSYTPPVHTLQYAVTLATFALAVAVAVGARDHLSGRAAAAAVALPLVQPAVVAVGRNLYAPSGSVLVAYLVFAAVLGGGLLAVGVALHRAADGAGGGGATGD